MEERKLYINGNISFTARDLRVMSAIVKQQNTTDKNKPGEYVLDGTYFYSIDKDYDVIINNIKR